MLANSGQLSSGGGILQVPAREESESSTKSAAFQVKPRGRLKQKRARLTLKKTRQTGFTTTIGVNMSGFLVLAALGGLGYWLSKRSRNACPGVTRNLSRSSPHGQSAPITHAQLRGAAGEAAVLAELRRVPFGIFVIETRNWRGAIAAGTHRDELLRTGADGSSDVRRSPLAQNRSKVAFLNEKLPCA